MADWFGKEIFKLGFGLMRLPKDADGRNDTATVSRMVDRFLEAGGTYFDTAFVYDSGDSERVIKEALIDRWPRDRFTLCTKLNACLPGLTEESAKQQFYTSLERTGAGYFDYYLMHALSRNNVQKYRDFHIWDFLREQKARGLIRYAGFSFHGDPLLLDELLTTLPQVDFIQLQINYADWNNPGVASRECYEIARRHGVSMTIMEPLKGGALANPNDDVRALFKSARPDLSPASWGIRYAASLEGVITVLSGMSNLAQMEDNLSYMRDFQPLGEEEYRVIEAVQAELEKDNSIPCTGCRYCVDGCPMGVAIPAIFAVKNKESGGWDGGRGAYQIATVGKGRASDCIACGQCEDACPQHLPIIDLLRECRSME